MSVSTSATVTAHHRRSPLDVAALLGVLGIVYGDIGTSPLYAFKAAMALFGRADVTATEIMGILSMIFWSLVLIVTVKYVILVMQADNKGEGGILALMVLAQRVCAGPKARAALGLVGLAGACLFFGDGVITPAISVLSAVEGLEVAAPQLADLRPADLDRRHHRAVRHAVARDGQRRAHLRPGDGGLVPCHRRAGGGRDRQASRRSCSRSRQPTRLPSA